MILVVCLNPAVDVTYTVNTSIPRRSHRVATVIRRAGGKGVNVARVTHSLNPKQNVELVGLAGVAADSQFAVELAQDDLANVATDFVLAEGELRRTVTVVDGRDATVFNEPGSHVAAEDWARFLALFRKRVRAARVVVLCGSLPPGVPLYAYAELTTTARDRGATVEGAGYRVRSPETLAGNPTGAGDALVATVAGGLARGLALSDLVCDAVAVSAAALAVPHAGDFDRRVVARLRRKPRVEEF